MLKYSGWIKADYLCAVKIPWGEKKKQMKLVKINGNMYLDRKLHVKHGHTARAACQETSTHFSKFNYTSHHFRPQTFFPTLPEAVAAIALQFPAEGNIH